MASITPEEKLPTRDTASQSQKRVVAAASIGTMIDWYDFFIFGTAAALFFPKLFFPSYDPLMGTLLSLGTFSVAFISRPLGAVVFGHLGDKVGRKNILVINLLIMGAGTAMIGLLPTYDAIGAWAPILLMLLRFVQGFGLGGEYGGAMSLVAEHAPTGKRGYYGGWVEMACPAGLVLSSTTVLVLAAALSDEALLSWGWRIPFLASVLLIVVGLIIRLKISESPTFAQLERPVHKSPVSVLFREHLGQTLKAGAIWLAVNVCFYLAAVFVISYGTSRLSLSYEAVLTAVIGAALVAIITCVWAGHLSDRLGRKRIGIIGCATMVLFAYPAFMLIDTGDAFLVFMGTSLILISTFLVAGIVPAYFSEMFETRVRYSGVSISIALGTLLGGGAAPSLAAAVMIWTGGSSWGVALMILLSGLIGIAAFAAIHNTFPVHPSEGQPTPAGEATTRVAPGQSAGGS
jgi:MHS family shikimate/dehydroshikimate transporter-like MFS transporter